MTLVNSKIFTTGCSAVVLRLNAGLLNRITHYRLVGKSTGNKPVVAGIGIGKPMPAYRFALTAYNDGDTVFEQNYADTIERQFV